MRLIVSADDFGASAAINRGVARACREGIVTSASLMAGGEAFEEALALVDDLPQLGVGAHLTLVAGRAVLPPARAPTLVSGDGSLPAEAGAFARSFFGGKITLADVRAELGAQLARLLAAGVRLTHLDSHQHLHHLPGVAAVVAELAREFGVRAARLGRCRLRPRGPRWWGRQLGLRFAAEAFGRLARRAGLRTPDGLVGHAWAGRLKADRLTAVMAELPPGTWELICHPAEAGTEAEAAEGYDRPGELAALTATEVAAAREEYGVRLINYAAL
ncbi:MAG: ChbG/HpnK family deacetylase [Candidatus Coatesbacteria bacterium]|nr:MAG: ChbG/HpnK family deacetylase [Candidatus Coatesbacteria bacterium]